MQKNQLQNNIPKKFPFDVIGKADPVSNLRLIKFHVPEKETEIEKFYRTEQIRIQEWNHMFWSRHNTIFRAVSVLHYSC